MKVIIIRPGEAAVYTDVDNELKALQEIVGGYIEAVAVTGFVVLCNEEGRIMGLPFCCKICGVSFFGPVVLCGGDGEEFSDIPVSKGFIDMILDMWRR